MSVEHLRSIVDHHKLELQNAVIRRGEWQFTFQHQQLEVPESTWFQMPEEAYEKGLHTLSYQPAALTSSSSSCTVPHTSESSRQFANSCVTFQENTQHDTPIVPSDTTDQASCRVLDVVVEDCGITTISIPTLRNIWNEKH